MSGPVILMPSPGQFTRSLSRVVLWLISLPHWTWVADAGAVPSQAAISTTPTMSAILKP